MIFYEPIDNVRAVLVYTPVFVGRSRGLQNLASGGNATALSRSHPEIYGAGPGALQGPS